LHKTKIISIFDYSIMPIGISITISSMSYKRPFKSARELDDLILCYFSYAGGSPSAEKKKANNNTITPSGPPTLSGLAFYLGFNSLAEFEAREAKGRFASRLQRARLYIEAIYESRLHSSTGAIYALKAMGHGEKATGKTREEQDNTFNIEIVGSGPKLAASEKDIVL
jgi:hypothetical protein